MDKAEVRKLKKQLLEIIIAWDEYLADLPKEETDRIFGDQDVYWDEYQKFAKQFDQE